MKLSLEDKKKIIHMHLKEHYGFTYISKVFNVNPSTIRLIVRRFQYNGKICIHEKNRRKYTPEFKEMIVKKVLAGQSKRLLTAQYDISGNTIINERVNKYNEFGYNGFIKKVNVWSAKSIMADKVEENENSENLNSLTDSERSEFEKLKKEYANLKKQKEFVDMENEFLKKVKSLVQKRLKQRKKK